MILRLSGMTDALKMYLNNITPRISQIQIESLSILRLITLLIAFNTSKEFIISRIVFKIHKLI